MSNYSESEARSIRLPLKLYLVIFLNHIKFDVSTNQKCSIEPSILSFLFESLLNVLEKNTDNAWGWR